MLLFLLVALTFLSCSTEGKEHVTCKRTFNKIGCFKEKKIVTIPLVNDRDKRPDQDTGYVITWHEIEEYLHSLACRCAAKAKENNLEYFGIRFYGECYGGNSALTKVQHASNACFQGISYGKCNDTNIKECGGQANADYIYKMISDESQDVDGGYSEWGAWSACSEECGGGLKRRNRACNNPVPKGAGKDCSSLGNETELAHCAVQPCPVDGGFSEWSLYGECDKKCGGGFQNRTRACNNPSPAHGGKNCEGALVESVSCNDSPCALDGQFTDWSAFGACNVKCGKGLQYRNRTCTNPPPSYGGKDCVGSYKDSRECFSGHCPVDGGYSGWKASGSCTKSCGGGDQLFIRTCDNPAPQHGGSDCSAIGPDSEQRQCNDQPCPVDGGFSEWSKFGSCSVSCGSGFKYRTRLCNNPLPAYNGTNCVGDLREALHCSIEHCKGNLALGKATKQSSTGWSGPSSKAVDGKKNTRYYDQSCTHTHRDQNPWWRVDLGARHVVGNIKVTNRGDCCSSRLRNVEVKVGDVDSPTGNALCTYYKHAFKAGESRTLSCSVPISGRYVYISLRTKEWLTLCEVEVYSPNPANVARGRPTKQSTTGWSGDSRRAVDGNTAAQYNHDSCTHTHKEQNPWWRVDLGISMTIGKVRVTNRADCCSGRLRNVEIRVGNTDNNPKVNQMCSYHPGAFKAGETRTMYCTTPVAGRYVYVTLRATEYLTLCEVEVYKADMSNLARGKPTKQSSFGWGGSSSRAVDGNVNTNYHRRSCTHTQREAGAWWRVDLGTPSNVGKVVITNRGDCCSNRLAQVEVWVGDTDDSPSSNQLCNFHQSALRAAETKSLYCSKPMIGRYVYVRIRVANYLTLCEVQVYSLEQDEKVDGGFSEWSAYGTCSVSCGGGLQFSTRACSNPFPSNGGSACAGAIKKSRRCNTKRCPVNGGFSNWSSWGRCSRSCGPGNQYRRRRCNNPIPRYGGKACTGNYRESQSCNLKPCPVHGGYGPWSAYGSCSATCGHGHQHRSRQCNSPRPSHGGRGCTVLGPSTERRVCHKKRCPSPVSPEYLSRVCEHSTLKIRCPAGSHIRISSALYGRRTKAYCRSGWMLFARTNCAARSSLHHVNTRCKNRQHCSVPAKNWLFGDPCIFTYKYLEVRHRCFGSTAQLHSAMVCEFKTKTISCPFGRQIQIVNAMYGRLNRKDCPYHKHTTTTNCKASSSLQKTKSACDGKHSCVLKASNGVYGDPCIYVHKYLDVKYKCIW